MTGDSLLLPPVVRPAPPKPTRRAAARSETVTDDAETPAPKGGKDGQRPARRRGRVIRRVVLWTVLALLAALVWLGVRVGIGVTAITSALPEATRLSQHVAAGDTVAARTSTDRIVEAVATARSMTGDPVWLLAETIPVLGANVEAVRVALESVDDAAEALPSAVSLAARFATESEMSEETLVEVIEASGDAADVAVAAQAAVQRVARVETAELLPVLASGVEDLSDALALVHAIADGAPAAATLVLELRGLPSPTGTLVLLVDRDSPRSGGGVPLAGFASATMNPGYAPTPIGGSIEQAAAALTADDLAAWPESAAASLGVLVDGRVDPTRAPAMAAAAELWAAGWSRATGQPISTVVMIDAEGVAGLAAAADAVLVPRGATLSPSEVETVLQGGDRGTLESLLSALVSRTARADWRLPDVVPAAIDAVSGGHVSVWSKNPSLEAHLADTRGAGVPPSPSESASVLTVALDHRSGSAPAWSVEVDDGRCGVPGFDVPTYRVRVTAAAADGASRILLRSPVGADVTAFDDDGTELPVTVLGFDAPVTVVDAPHDGGPVTFRVRAARGPDGVEVWAPAPVERRTIGCG